MEHHGADRSGTGTRVGERLAAERTAQGISLDDVALRTRIPLRTLETLETGATTGLPALTYTAGFVRSYGDLLGLDGSDLARQFRIESGRAPQAPLPEAYEVADPAHIPTKWLAIVGLVVALLIAGGYAIWRGDGLFGGGAEERARLAAGTAPVAPQAVAPTASLGGPAAPVVTAAPPADALVVVAATQDVWLKIYERDGRALFVGTMPAGQTFTVPADAADPLIRTGRPEAVTVRVGATPVPPLGPPDTLVKDRSLKREALLAAVPIQPLVPPAGAVSSQTP